MNFDEFMQQECPDLALPTLPHGVTMSELEAELGNDPDWQKIKCDPNQLHHRAQTIYFRRLRERGVLPPTFTAVRECEECGPVWLEPWNPPKIAGCVWCLNRMNGLPVPVPGASEGQGEKSGCRSQSG